MRLPAVALLLFCGACRGAGDMIAYAAFNTALAVGASAASRASGGCYAECPIGTYCDMGTGLCAKSPCDDRDPATRCGTAEIRAPSPIERPRPDRVDPIPPQLSPLPPTPTVPAERSPLTDPR
ncbi:MAG: hypothetical protein ACYDCL_12445 [Myxococcales bacterium]